MMFYSEFFEIKNYNMRIEVRGYSCSPIAENLNLNSLRRVGIYDKWFNLGLF